MDTSLFDIQLPKWAGILIHGKSVTPEQAKAIIHATDHSLYSDMEYAGNNQAFQKAYLAKSLGAIQTMVPFYRGDCKSDIELKINSFVREFDDQLSPTIPLEFLKNYLGHSCHMGGPVGWCHPSGDIFLSDKNIGKYPCVGILFDEWKAIAKKFDFLQLTCIVLSSEWCDDETPRGLVGFSVSGGEVTLFKPSESDTEELTDTIHYCNAVESVSTPYDRTVLEEFLGVQIPYEGELGLPNEFYFEAIEAQKNHILSLILASTDITEDEIVTYIESKAK
jgi:hypothetical protein